MSAHITGQTTVTARATRISTHAATAVSHSMRGDWDAESDIFNPRDHTPEIALARYWGGAQAESSRADHISIIAGRAAELVDNDATEIGAASAMAAWEAKSNLPPAHTLTAKLNAALCEYWRRIEAGPPDDAPEGISWPDAVLIDMLRDITAAGGNPDKHHYGRDLAAEQAKSARKRFATAPHRAFFDLSAPGLCHYPRLLAKALWLDQVKPSADRVRKNRPALPVPVYDRHIAAVFTKGRVARKAESTDQFNLFSEGNMLLAQIPAMPPANLRRIIEAGTNEMRSTTSFRLINHLITQAHLRTYAGHQNPRVLRFDGGISALADAIGETSKPGRAKLESILEAGHQWQVEWPGGKAGGLWSYWYDDTTGPGKRAQLEITLGAPLSPRYALKNLGKGDRFLVPIVPIAPLIRPFSNHIDQAIFQLLIVGELVTQRMQIAERGSAEITDARLQQLADQAGLSRKTWPRVIERWTRDGEPGDKGSAQGAKFLEKTGRNRYHLADNATYGLAKAFIDAGAEKALKGRKMGRRKKRIK